LLDRRHPREAGGEGEALDVAREDAEHHRAEQVARRAATEMPAAEGSDGFVVRARPARERLEREAELGRKRKDVRAKEVRRPARHLAKLSPQVDPTPARERRRLP